MIRNLSASSSLGDNLSPYQDLASPASSTSTSTSNSVHTSPLKLQVFTSSPRTLAMIEKYMNPKPKRNGIGEKIRNSLRRRGLKSSKKLYFQKSLRGLHGIVNVNPNVNIVETRSEDLGETASDCNYNTYDDEDTHSVSSTRSSMSAFLRRTCVSSEKRSYHQISNCKIRTVTPIKSERKRRIFRKKLKKDKKNKKPILVDELDELEVLQMEDDPTPAIPTTPTNANKCKSPRLRLTPYLRTPKRANKRLDNNREVENIRSPIEGRDEICNSFFSEGRDESGSTLDVTEKGPKKSSSDLEKLHHRDHIKAAMRDWSFNIGQVIIQKFKKGKKKNLQHTDSEKKSLTNKEQLTISTTTM